MVETRAAEYDQPSVIVEHRERQTLMIECIEALPERDRILISMYYMDDLRLVAVPLQSNNSFTMV